MKLAGLVVLGVVALAIGVGFMASYPHADTPGFMLGLALSALGALSAIGATAKLVIRR